MDKKIFENLQNHVFDKDNPWPIWAGGSKKPNRLPYFSSWAVWNNSDLKDVTFINPENAYRLKPGIVFVALNLSKPLQSNWSDWQNVHDVERVYNLLRGTRFEGAYITDIIKNHPEADSRVLLDHIKTGKIDINVNINCFFEEIDLLETDAIEMYLFGDAVEGLFKKYVEGHEKFSAFSRKIKRIQRIDHYSDQVTRFERTAPAQLGLVSDPEAKIFDPLWPKPEKDKPQNVNNSRKFPAGKNAVSPPDTNDPRVELRRLKIFLENNCFPMHSLLKDTNRKILGSSERNRTFFYIAQDGNNFTFHWESHNHDEKWFYDRKAAISKSFPGSKVTTGAVCRLWIPVDQDRYCESILDIVNKTKGKMVY
jgi:hypothetical protein